MHTPEEIFQEELNQENNMIRAGIIRYKDSVRTAQQDDRGSDTQYGTRLMAEYCTNVAQYIRAQLDTKSTPGPKQKALGLLERVQPEVAAFIGLKVILNYLAADMRVTPISIKIGGMIEDEIRFDAFRREQPEYFQSIVEDFKRKGSRDYNTKHRIFTRHAINQGIRFQDWTVEERVQVGSKIIEAITEVTDIIEVAVTKGYKTNTAYLVPTEAAVKWVTEFIEKNSSLLPLRGPTIIQPDDWVSNDQGGYWLPDLRVKTKLVKTNNPLAKERLRNVSGTILSAVNALQATEWSVNTEVLDVLKEVWRSGLEIGIPKSTPIPIPECPFPPDKKPSSMTPEEFKVFKEWKFTASQLYSDDKERISKCFEVQRVIKMAQQYLNKPIYFVYQCDFRGRMYPATSALSPQGADFNKALLVFNKGKALGEAGVPWFLIHGANTYGIDKVSFDDRIKWVNDQTDRILALAKDPLGMLEFWKAADKPYQFLAWAFEFSRYKQSGTSFVSHIPVGLDGTCNGLQNYSAMLRDPIGGKAVNLVPAEWPSDIYAEVSKILSIKVLRETDEKFNPWKKYLRDCGGCFPRGLAKRPVMTLPYGVSMHSCRDYVSQFCIEEKIFPKNQTFAQASLINPLLWAAMGEVVVKARQAMDWVKEVAKITAEQNKAMTWYSPAGFPVVQDRRQTVDKIVNTKISGRLRLLIRFDKADTDGRKQVQACAPNFIHSYDAAHAMFTLNAALNAGMTDFQFIHDDFGTYAADIPVFFNIIRAEFVKMYATSTPLQELKNCVELDTGVRIPEPPIPGMLDLHQVLESTYFFS